MRYGRTVPSRLVATNPIGVPRPREFAHLDRRARLIGAELLGAGLRQPDPPRSRGRGSLNDEMPFGQLRIRPAPPIMLLRA